MKFSKKLMQLFKALASDANCGLYYKPIMIVNDESRVVNKFETSLTDNARVIIYDRHMFIVQATGFVRSKKCCPGFDVSQI
jgi:hypothetical protein